MEPEIKAFLLRIMYSVFTVICWMVINATAGIMYGFGFIEKKISLGNILFYLWLAGSFYLLYRIYHRLWTKPLPDK
jgi:ABC-type glycerol-3-phosphate transport system permease component